MPLTLTNIPDGETVFIDANIFVYAFGGHVTFATQCTELLERVEQKRLLGVASAAIVSEVAHRIMTIEACETFG